MNKLREYLCILVSIFLLSCNAINETKNSEILKTGGLRQRSNIEGYTSPSESKTDEIFIKPRMIPKTQSEINLIIENLSYIKKLCEKEGDAAISINTQFVIINSEILPFDVKESLLVIFRNRNGLEAVKSLQIYIDYYKEMKTNNDILISCVNREP